MVMCLCMITSDKIPVRFGSQQDVVADHECSRALQMRRWGCLNGNHTDQKDESGLYSLPCLREVYLYKSFMVIWA